MNNLNEDYRLPNNIDEVEAITDRGLTKELEKTSAKCYVPHTVWRNPVVRRFLI